MAHLPSQATSNIKRTQQLEASMTLRCKDGDLAIIVGELPGCEANIGRIVQVRGPAHISEQCGDLLCWVIKPIDRKKMLILYIPDILVSDYVTWKMDIKLPDCWLIPIRPLEEDKYTVVNENLPLEQQIPLAV
jgi:hypothetical protein